MSPFQSPSHPSAYDREVVHDPAQVAFLQQVLSNFGFTLLLAASTAYAAWGLPREWFLPLIVLELVLAFAASLSRGSATTSAALVYAFAAVSGATTVPLLKWALHTTGETGVIYNALAVTGAIFMGMAWYGSSTRRDLSSWSTFLTMGLLGSLVVSVIGLFVGYSTVGQLVLSSVVVITFAGFVAYDLQSIRDGWRQHTVATATLTLYLDFLNLFVNLLRILVLINGGGRSRD